MSSSGRIEKSILSITVYYQETCRVMTYGDPEGWILLSYPHTNNDFFLLLTTAFYHLFYLKISFYTRNCTNMNSTSLITFVTYLLPQYGIRFYKGLFVTFKLAPDLKKNTVDLSSNSPLNEGYLSILTNSMLRK